MGRVGPHHRGRLLEFWSLFHCVFFSFGRQQTGGGGLPYLRNGTFRFRKGHNSLCRYCMRKGKTCLFSAIKFAKVCNVKCMEEETRLTTGSYITMSASPPPFPQFRPFQNNSHHHSRDHCPRDNCRLLRGQGEPRREGRQNE